jgi:hypothetical protein
MKRQIQLTVGNDSGRSRIGSLAALTNLYAEAQANTSSQIPVSLINAPGTRKLFTVKGGIQITGFHATATKIFFTTRKGLYEITGTSYILRYAFNIVDRASIADNGTIVIVVDGYSAHSYNMDNGATAVVDIPRSRSIIFIDGYFISVDVETNRQRVSGFYTDVFNDPVNEANCEGSPDNIQGVAPLNRQAILFNQTSIEPWYVSGEDYPFNPNLSAFIDRGCYTPFSFCTNDNTVFWLGDDLRVYRLNGYSPEPISTHAIEYELSLYDCSEAYMLTSSQEGHDFVFLQIPSMKRTLVYDTATRLWHYRTTGNGRHLSNTMITVNGVTYVGSGDSATVSVFDSDIGNDNGIPIPRKMITPVDNYHGRVNSCELILQHFNPPTPAKLSIDMTDAERLLNPEWPVIELSYTDDDGRSWSEPDPIQLEPNNELRAVWYKLGYPNRRSYKFETKADMACIWAGVWLA